MAAHNAEGTIAEALESLTRQRCAVPFEVVVVDDRSSDGTAAAVLSLKDVRVRLIRLEKNVGRAAARNIAAENARFDVLVVADADDRSVPTRLQAIWEALEADDSLNVVGGQMIDLLPNGTIDRSEFRFPVGDTDVDRAFQRGVMGLAHPTTGFRASWFRALGGYDPLMAWCEDFDLMLRGWRPGSYFASSEVLIEYRRKSRVTSWEYWWENDRHHHAILAPSRIGGVEVAWHDRLRRSSSRARRMYSFIKYIQYRLVLVARTSRAS